MRGVFGGRSLYVGGSDDYFKNNFKADPDDMLAMKTNKQVKVFGNRFAATADAIKREGLGNLMKANKGRVAAGLGILAAGGAATGYLANEARKQFTGRGKVKSYTRRSKTGKLVQVREAKRNYKR